MATENVASRTEYRPFARTAKGCATRGGREQWMPKSAKGWRTPKAAHGAPRQAGVHLGLDDYGLMPW
jgi:hypothetical protein